MTNHHKINYLELPAKDLAAAKAFFTAVFGWSFMDYGPDYCSFMDAGIDGGFFTSDQYMSTANGAALIVFYSERLDQSQAKVEAAGGTILKHHTSL